MNYETTRVRTLQSLSTSLPSLSQVFFESFQWILLLIHPYGFPFRPPSLPLPDGFTPRHVRPKSLLFALSSIKRHRGRSRACACRSTSDAREGWQNSSCLAAKRGQTRAPLYLLLLLSLPGSFLQFGFFRGGTSTEQSSQK